MESWRASLLIVVRIGFGRLHNVDGSSSGSNE